MTYEPNDILLNKYRVEKLLGEGACAKVYLATHKGLQAPRALKILRKDAPGLGSTDIDEFRRRFQLEAQLGAKLGENPHIIQVHDFEQEHDLLILVMEYATGGSLAERIKAARSHDASIPVNEVLQIGLGVAQGLSALHALDAVHRDLKPSNILFDKKGRAKVADVGLAQIPGGPSMRSKISHGVPHPGTPGYMSPEQKKISNYLTPASDVYSLGLVLFEALTGRVYRSQKPGTRAKELREEIPVELDDLLARMLSKIPEERPWGGKEVVVLLAEFIQREKEKRQEENARREAEAQARRESQEKARREVEERARQQAAERKRLGEQVQKAIQSEKWSQATELIRRIKSMGKEGQRQAEELQSQFNQVKAATKRRKAERAEKEAQEITRLENAIKRALISKNWSKVKSLIAKLETFGPQGKTAAKRYQARLPKFWESIPLWGWLLLGGMILVSITITLVLIGLKAAESEKIVGTVIVEKEVAVEVTSPPTDTPRPTDPSAPTSTPILPAPTSTDALPSLTSTPALPAPTSTPIPPAPAPTNTPIPPAPTSTDAPPAPTNTPIPPAPTNTPIPPAPTSTDAPPAPTNTDAPPAFTNTPIPSTFTNTPKP